MTDNDIIEKAHSVVVRLCPNPTCFSLHIIAERIDGTFICEVVLDHDELAGAMEQLEKQKANPDRPSNKEARH